MIGYDVEKKQEEKKVCPKCNEEIDNKAKFCPNCGTKISNDTDFYDNCIKEFIKKSKIDEFNSRIFELDDEKESSFIIKNTTVASNIFKLKIMKTVYARGLAYCREEQKELAIFDFSDVIKWVQELLNDSNSLKALENSDLEFDDKWYIYSIYFRGRLYIETDQYNLAIKDWNSFLNIVNRDGYEEIADFKEEIFEAYFYRALSYLMLKDTQRAKLDINKALELNPNNEDANALYKAINDENNKTIDIKELIKKIFS